MYVLEEVYRFCYWDDMLGTKKKFQELSTWCPGTYKRAPSLRQRGKMYTTYKYLKSTKVLLRNLGNDLVGLSSGVRWKIGAVCC